MEYKIIRSKRKTVALTVEKNGQVVVKAPAKATKEYIDIFVNKNIAWIEKMRRKHMENAARGTKPTRRQIEQMKIRALQVMSQKTRHFARIMGTSYTHVKITGAKSRWGSCSAKDGICYSYRVMFLSDRRRDYIAVHELSHTKVKNHSAAFYREIENILPCYRDIEREIKSFSNFDLY